MDVDMFGRRTFDEERVKILKFLVRQKIDSVFSDDIKPADPLKVFVKQEPHKISKIQEGRERLIQAVSLVDTMIDRILFGEMLRVASSPEMVGMTPCLVGWAPWHSGWRLIQKKFGDNSMSIDRKAWDWTVQEWLVSFWNIFLKEMHPGAPVWWSTLVDYRLDQLFYHAIFKFQDGLMVVQEHPGIMKSGCLLTLILNSVSQVYLHCVAMMRIGQEPTFNIPFCVGDDTIMNVMDCAQSYATALSTLCVVKEVEITNGFHEFVGFLFDKTGFYPAYFLKHIFAIRHVDEKEIESTMQNYQMLWYNSEFMLSIIRRVLFQISPSLVLSDRALRKLAG